MKTSNRENTEPLAICGGCGVTVPIGADLCGDCGEAVADLNQAIIDGYGDRPDVGDGDWAKA